MKRQIMKRQIRNQALIAIAACLVLFQGCQKVEDSNQKTGQNPSDTELFAQPETTVKTFLRAAAQADIELLSQCFAPNCEQEFTVIREKKASEEQLKELTEMVSGAIIGETQIMNDNAQVAVKFKKRDEQINLVRTDQGWKIVGF